MNPTLPQQTILKWDKKKCPQNTAFKFLAIKHSGQAGCRCTMMHLVAMCHRWLRSGKLWQSNIFRMVSEFKGYFC